METKLRQADNGVTRDQMPVQLPPNCMQEAAYQYTDWAVMAPNGLKAENLLVPGFWALYATKMRPFDEIRARAEDGTWMARYVVLEAGRTWARVHLLEMHNLGTQDVSLTKAVAQNVEDAKKAFNVLHRGPRAWSVVRIADKHVMHEGEQTKDAANAWLDGHLKTAGVGEPATAAT